MKVRGRKTPERRKNPKGRERTESPEKTGGVGYGGKVWVFKPPSE